MTTRDQIERARQLVRDQTWARSVFQRAASAAERLRSAGLPRFETAWRDEARRKHWSETYAEVNRHTHFAVAPAIHQGYRAAVAAAVSDDPAHVDGVRRMLLHYAKYQFFAEHPDVGLNWSTWCLRALQAYDLAYLHFSETERAQLDYFFLHAMQAVRKNDEWWIRNNPGGNLNNHFAWHKLMIGAHGLFYGNSELVDYALNSSQGVRELIEGGVRDDGLWHESSINYHFTALDPLVLFAASLANAGHTFDLWNHVFAGGRSLKQLVLGPIQVAFPDKTLPTIGDAYARRLRLSECASYWLAYDAYRSPEIAWLLREATERPVETLLVRHLPGDVTRAPAMKTRRWPEHGYVALRTQEGPDYWRGSGFSVFLSHDLDGIHSHHDKFDLIIFARGGHVAVDPEAAAGESHAFSANVQRELNRSTVRHNTIMVDRAEQQSISEKLEMVELADRPDAKMAAISDNRGLIYPGVRIVRTVVATDEYVLDVFQLASKAQHDYAYLFHSCDDEGTFHCARDMRSVSLGESAPWKRFRNARAADVDGDWSAWTRQGDLRTRLTMLGRTGTRLTFCEFPRNDRFEPPAIPMLMAERRAACTIFVAVVESEHGALPDTKIGIVEDSSDTLRITGVRAGFVREFVVPRLK